MWAGLSKPAAGPACLGRQKTLRSDNGERPNAKHSLEANAQPKRLVMYSSVRLFCGAVKSFSVVPNSINSPRNMNAV